MYTCALVQWGSPVPVALLARHPLESSLADDQFYSLPFILGIHCHWPTPGNTSLKILSCFDIALILTLLSLSWTIMEPFHIFTHITNQKLYWFHWSMVNRPKNLGRGQPPSFFLGSTKIFLWHRPQPGIPPVTVLLSTQLNLVIHSSSILLT